MNTIEELASQLNELESKVGVAPGFFGRLLEEDDWSFVIKLHALFEAACTHLLLYHFAEPNLSDVFSRLELSGKSTGKLEFLGKLELLGKEKRRFISTLSELRNSLVHDVRNSEFSLQSFVSTLNPDSLKSFAAAFSPFESMIKKMSANPKGFPIDSRLVEQSKIENLRDRLLEHPKQHIWLGAFDVFRGMLEIYNYSDYKQWSKAKEIFDADEEE